jgi:hypothetical protein
MYLLTRRALQLVVVRARGDTAKDVELLVLRVASALMVVSCVLLYIEDSVGS